MSSFASMIRRMGRLSLATCLILALVLPMTAMTGCGPRDPTEAELDRVPNVPPSTRGTESSPAGRVLVNPGR